MPNAVVIDQCAGTFCQESREFLNTQLIITDVQGNFKQLFIFKF
jgi:hypothetical protein